jgi:hypothetical protein
MESHYDATKLDYCRKIALDAAAVDSTEKII